MPKFTGTIYKLGINPVVDPPEDILSTIFIQAGRSKSPIPVKGNINGFEFAQTLVRYGGKWRLYINGQMLKGSGLGVGDEASIEIEFDRAPRAVAVPGAFARALEKDEAARAAFAALVPSRQKEILRYLGSLKTDAAFQRNMARLIANLSGHERTAHVTLRKRPKTKKNGPNGPFQKRNQKETANKSRQSSGLRNYRSDQ